MFWNAQQTKMKKDFWKSTYMISSLPFCLLWPQLLNVHLFSISQFFQLQKFNVYFHNLIETTGATATIWNASPELCAHNLMLSTIINWRITTVIKFLTFVYIFQDICSAIPLGKKRNFIKCLGSWFYGALCFGERTQDVIVCWDFTFCTWIWLPESAEKMLWGKKLESQAAHDWSKEMNEEKMTVLSKICAWD